MNRNLKLLIILFLLFISSFTLTFYLYNPLNLEDNNIFSPIINPFSTSNESPFSMVTLGSTDYGSATREGPYGNSSSPIKIAVIAGVHPLEAPAHLAFIESLKEQNNTLQYCYYVYRVNVTRDADDYEKGRDHGQILAKEYVVPDIQKENFELAVDVHSNRGNYQVKRFVYVPADSPKAKGVASQLVNRLNWLSLFTPPNPTSPEYVAIPLIKSGIPAVLYETYAYEPYNQTRTQADQFMVTLDQIDLGE